MIYLLIFILCMGAIAIAGMWFTRSIETTREKLTRQYHNVAQQYATIYDRDYSCGTSLAEQISSELYGLRQQMTRIAAEARKEMDR